MVGIELILSNFVFLYQVMGGKRVLKMCTLAFVLFGLASLQEAMSHGVHPLSKIATHRTTYAFDDHAYVNVTPTVLGVKVYNLQ